jgi:hypothetical protein
MELTQRAPLGLRTFCIERQDDESGISGTGLVLEGVVFSTGLTVIHWLTPPPFGSTSIWTSFEQFMSIHVGPHPTNNTRVIWDDGEIWEPGEYRVTPSPFTKLHTEGHHSIDG